MISTLEFDLLPSYSPPMETEASSVTCAPAPEPEKSPDKEASDAVEYPTGARFAFIILAISLALFLVSLDSTIIAVAIPKITDQFHSLDDVGWYGSAYLLGTAAFQLFFGRLYSFLSVKRVFLSSLCIFEIGSLVCAIAPSSNALIAGRAIAGLANAGVLTGIFVIIADSVPLERRPFHSGALGATYGVASVSGPLLGGVLTDKVSWRWCFYINLPLTAAVIACIAVLFKDPQVRCVESMSLARRVTKLDPWGTAVFMPAITSLLLALQWGGSKYQWQNPRIIVLFILFALLTVMFVVIQIWKQDEATVPPRIMKQRTILAAAAFIFCLGGSVFTTIYFLPLYFQAIKGVTAVRSGVDNIPFVVALSGGCLVTGALVSRLGYYNPPMLLSVLLTSVGGGLISTFDRDTPPARWVSYQIVYGLGVGCGIQQGIMAAQAVLAIGDVPVGTTIMLFMQLLGGAIFVSAGQTVFQNRLLIGLATHVPGVDPQLVFDAGATNLRSVVPMELLASVLEVYNDALRAVYYLIVALAGLSIFGALGCEWRSVKGKGVSHAAL
ncbi:major facilitator superfamily transporter [Roridomyces roridus]|uniref:Major facilitator superfamily transporter n=1 Tax=Roridomyces roridus TaxID=1738132 RepID=A0AAD7BIR8_9AGAR|nr:major facilitator superfamily transporter [Roridomyces roridus]